MPTGEYKWAICMCWPQVLILFIVTATRQKTSHEFIEERMKERCGFIQYENVSWSHPPVDHNHSRQDNSVRYSTCPHAPRNDHDEASNHKKGIHLTIRPGAVLNIQTFCGNRIPLPLYFRQVRLI